MKKILKAILIVIIAVVVIAALYAGYLFISFHRIGDNVELAVNGGSAAAEKPETGKTYKIVSWNIGFGAYEDDYGFFMDGGTQSWAWSKDRLDLNLNDIVKTIKKNNADFYFIQEVDFDSTRSYHLDERDYMKQAFDNCWYTFAQNYDSPFLMYPLTQPHGASRAGLMVFSNFKIDSAVRRELPIESGITKFLDLDRCYSVNRIPTANGKELVLINFHLSAYTSDGKIANEQLKLVLDVMQEEYKKGNYVIAGGDFNKDILGDSSKYFGKSDIEYTWAQPIPDGMFDGYPVKLVAPLNEASPVPSCRNADGPYHEGQYVLTIDGFMITDNIKAVGSNVIDTKFEYSDHNPVYMEFVLN